MASLPPNLTKKQFDQLVGRGFNRIPVYRVLEARKLQPLSLYRCFNPDPAAGFLLESMRGLEHEKEAVSIISLPLQTEVIIAEGGLEVRNNGIVIESISAAEPFDALRLYQSRFRSPPVRLEDHFELPFCGGLVGSFAYDLLRSVEPRLAHSAPADHSLGTPDVHLLQCEEYIVSRQLVNGQGYLVLVVCADTAVDNAWDCATLRLERMQEQLGQCRGEVQYGLSDAERKACSDDRVEQEAFCAFSQQAYMDAVERIRDYIYSGDVMQVVPSRRLEVPLDSGGLEQLSAFDVYCAVRSLNPPRYQRYMYYIDFGEYQVAGASPETLVKLNGSRISTSPIAGTRKRGRDVVEDRAMAEELLSDPKEKAEHLMLIDLGRNDVGKVSRIGTVEVPEMMMMKVELYSHVMHIVSQVTGQLREGLDALDVLRAILPAGTLSGAPKIRAMQIIDEFEPVRRSLYGGAVGYLSWNGDMNTAVAIRTAVIKKGILYSQVGGGIVADSIPRLEWKETSNKARGMMRALSLARFRGHCATSEGVGHD